MSSSSSSPAPSESSSFQKKLIPGIIAAVSSLTATAMIQPFDTLKSRMQVSNEAARPTGFVLTSKEMMASGGVGAFYSGLSSALLRQAFYGTIRVGLYRYLFQQEADRNNGSVAYLKKVMFSVCSGAVGSFFGSPFDIVLVRMQVDGSLPKQFQRNYTGVVDGLVRILREEGPLAYWKGYSINWVRSATLSSVMLSTNDEVKERVNSFRGIKKSDVLSNMIAAGISGIACSFCSLPLDNIKMKFQKMTPGPDGKMPYTGIPNIITKTLKNEGLRGFWTGYSAFYLRVGPHAMVMLILNDVLHRKYDPNYKM